MTAVAMPFARQSSLLHVPLHRLLRSIDAEASGHDRCLQVAPERWMDFADRSQRGPHAHSHGLPGALVAITGEARASAEAKRGDELGRDEVALLAESGCLANVRIVLGVRQLVLDFGEASSICITGLSVQVRASIARVGTRRRATSRLDKVEDVDCSTGRREQRRNVAHPLGVRHCGGPAPPAKVPDAPIAAKLTGVR